MLLQSALPSISIYATICVATTLGYRDAGWREQDSYRLKARMCCLISRVLVCRESASAADQGANICRVRVYTRMGRDSQFSVGLLNLQLGCRWRDTEGVIVAGIDNHADNCHWWSSDKSR